MLTRSGNVQSNASCNEKASEMLESNNGFLNGFFNKNYNTFENVMVDETCEVVEDFVDDLEIEGLLNTVILEVEDIQENPMGVSLRKHIHIKNKKLKKLIKQNKLLDEFFDSRIIF